MHKMVFFRAFSEIFFKGKLGRRAIIGFLGGCESDERGVSDPAGRLSYYNNPW